MNPPHVITPLRFQDLNPVGRAIILTVAALTAGVAAVAFLTSYGALYAFVRDTGLYSDRLARIYPLLLDAAFIVAELVAILFGIIRGPKGWPWFTMVLTGALTVFFNVSHAGHGWDRRLVAALPPVMMMLAFQVDVSVVRSVMRALGRTEQAFGGVGFAAPLSAFAGYGAGTFPPQGAFGEMPSVSEQRAGQNGHDRGWKTEQTREYLASLDPGELAAMTRGQLTADMATLGVPIDESYAGSILGKYRANGTKVRRR